MRKMSTKHMKFDFDVKCIAVEMKNLHNLPQRPVAG